MTTTLEESPAATPFSTVIREASRGEHEEAESTGFASALVAGTLPLEAYAATAAQTWFVYTALEEAAEAQRTDPVGATFYFPELLRVPSLEQDLDFLVGPSWRSEIEPLPATERYRERVRALCSDSASMFMAHQYTRYLGDLSGGQIIRRTLAKAYELDQDGIRFYIFSDIPKPKVFKDQYRARVDAAPWDEAERERIVAEIKTAFRLNTELLDDLGRVYAGRFGA
jgi:heme oxygenase